MKSKNKADSQCHPHKTHNLSLQYISYIKPKHSVLYLLQCLKYEPGSLTRARVRRIPAFLSVVLTTFVILLYRYRFVNHFSQNFQYFFRFKCTFHDSARYSPQTFHTAPMDLSLQRPISQIHSAFLSGKTAAFLLSKKGTGNGQSAVISFLRSQFLHYSYFSLKLAHSVCPTAMAPSPAIVIRSALH